MVDKGNPADGHPGNILGKVGNAQETGSFIPLNDPAEKGIKLTGNADPPDGRVSHTADGAYIGCIYHVICI